MTEVWLVVAVIPREGGWVDSVWSTEQAAKERCSKAITEDWTAVDTFEVERHVIDAAPTGGDQHPRDPGPEG